MLRRWRELLDRSRREGWSKTDWRTAWREFLDEIVEELLDVIPRPPRARDTPESFALLGKKRTLYGSKTRKLLREAIRLYMGGPDPDYEDTPGADLTKVAALRTRLRQLARCQVTFFQFFLWLYDAQVPRSDRMSFEGRIGHRTGVGKRWYRLWLIMNELWWIAAGRHTPGRKTDSRLRDTGERNGGWSRHDPAHADERGEFPRERPS
jgi:hypothetical protein